MELLFDPSTYAALGTLVVIEVVLGIDNLVFIAILAEKLPPEQRDKARITGLSMALLMRIFLLTLMSWLVGLTKPLFYLGTLHFSARDLIMLVGGLFLIYKAVHELHERLDPRDHHFETTKEYGKFWTVVIQIIVLDAVFSLDAVITAVGMVEHLSIMIAAVSIAIGVMLVASKPLMDFVNKHPTVVVLCLGFLLLIGLSLIAEGFSFHIPKGYIYAAISFSIIIEAFNHVARYNMRKTEGRRPLRIKTALAVARLMGENAALVLATPEGVTGEDKEDNEAEKVSEEVNIVSRVLTLSERTVRSIMTYRNEVVYLDLDNNLEEQKTILLEEGFSTIPVCRGGLDNIIGIASAAQLWTDIMKDGAINTDNLTEPHIIPETMRVVNVLKLLRETTPHFIFVADEYGTIEGIITAIDVFEAVAGEMIEEGETPPVMQTGNHRWVMSGTVDVHLLQNILDISDLVSETNDYSSLAGFILAELERMPEVGDHFIHNGYRFEVLEIKDRRISQVKVEMVEDPRQDKES